MADKEREAMQQREVGNFSHSPYSSVPNPQPPAGAIYNAHPTVTTGILSTPAIIDTHVLTGPVMVFDENSLAAGVIEPPKKSILEAYMLAIPLGFLGAHHFYLGRHFFGVVYFLTFGLLGCGWLIDLFRLPCLVRDVNKQAKERAWNLARLKQLQQQQQHSQGCPNQPNIAYVVRDRKSLADAYILWFPLGFLGFHHFYLRNVGLGVLYFLSFGLLGFGWIIDAFRLPSLVKEANSNLTEPRKYNTCTAHILSLSPAGILGAHHYYLNRPIWGVLYSCTLGLFGIGWICDWFRMVFLVRRANSAARGQVPRDKKYLDDAYILCFSMGFLGMHHFYLKRPVWGFLYFFTIGIFGVGWIIDWFRLPCLVKEYNSKMDGCGRRLVGGTPAPFSKVEVPGTTNTDTGAPCHNGGYQSYNVPSSGFVTVTQVTANGNQASIMTSTPGPVSGYGGCQVTQNGFIGPSYLGPYPTYTSYPHEAQAGAQVLPPPQYAPHPAFPTDAVPPGPPSYEASIGYATNSKN